jgi:hypothetical protein
MGAQETRLWPYPKGVCLDPNGMYLRYRQFTLSPDSRIFDWPKEPGFLRENKRVFFKPEGFHLNAQSGYPH